MTEKALEVQRAKIKTTELLVQEGLPLPPDLEHVADTLTEPYT
jgi:hypothetical protein